MCHYASTIIKEDVGKLVGPPTLMHRCYLCIGIIMPSTSCKPIAYNDTES